MNVSTCFEKITSIHVRLIALQIFIYEEIRNINETFVS